jgi:hypothetical protein
VEHLGAKQLKNIAEPVGAFRVLGAPGEKPRSQKTETPSPRRKPEGAGERRLGVVMALESEPSPGPASAGAAAAGLTRSRLNPQSA